MLYFNYFTNPCQQVLGRISAIIEQPKTVWQIIKEQKVDLTMPIICLINGVPVLRKNLGNVFDDGELISIISLPLGGGGGKKKLKSGASCLNGRGYCRLGLYRRRGLCVMNLKQFRWLFLGREISSKTRFQSNTSCHLKTRRTACTWNISRKALGKQAK